MARGERVRPPQLSPAEKPLEQRAAEREQARQVKRKKTSDNLKRDFDHLPSKRTPVTKRTMCLTKPGEHLYGRATGQTFELYEGRFGVFQDTRHRGEKPRFVLVAEQYKLQKLEPGTEAEISTGRVMVGWPSTKGEVGDFGEVARQSMRRA